MNYTLIIVSGGIAVGMPTIGFFLFINVSQARSMERKQTWQASHDPLTR